MDGCYACAYTLKELQSIDDVLEVNIAGCVFIKGIMHISSNPLARKPVIPRIAPENFHGVFLVVQSSQRGGY